MPSGRILAIVLLGLFAAAPARAADTGQGEIGVDTGYADLAERMGGGGPLAAVRGGYHFATWFEVEAEAARLLPDCPEGECSDLWVFLINFVFNFHPGPSVVPYLYLGIGYTNFDEEPAFSFLEDQFEGQAVYQPGAGCRFFPGKKKRTGFRVEVSESFFEDEQSPNAQVGMVWRLGSQP